MSEIWLRVSIVTLVWIAAVPARVEAGPLSVSYKGSVNLPVTMAVDQHGTAFTITGMSGVSYLGPAELFGGPQGVHRFAAVMDNSSRVVYLNIGINLNGTLSSVAVAGGLTLDQSLDFEGIAYTGPARDSVLFSEEGAPGIQEFARSDGSSLLALSIPAVYGSRRVNFGFESLTLLSPPSGPRTLWTANEEALSVDGPVSSPSNGTEVRIQSFIDSAGGFTAGGAGGGGGQFVLLTEPMHGSAISSGRSGLSELVATPDGRLIALERSFAFSFSTLFLSRLFELDFAGASDVSSLPSLVGQSYSRIAKRTIWSGNAANLEGLTLGPKLSAAGGVSRYALIGVVDDADPISNNTVVAFDVNGIVEPCAADLDWSGTVDADDIFAFLTLWFAGPPGAVCSGCVGDWNTDGTITSDDLFSFLTRWFAELGGC